MTLLRLGILGSLVLLGSTAPAAAAEAASSCATTVAPASPFAVPAASSASRFWYGSEALAVLLPRSGTWRGMGPSHKYRNKLFWWRQGYSGATEPQPELVVSGRRLDGEAPPATVSRATNAHHMDFGGWAMLVTVEFPASGCWEVAGQYKGQIARFVVDVVP
jgi:hypothetical protein